MTSYALPTLLADSGLSNYLNEIKGFPILDVEEELSLARKYQETGEAEAAHRLVTSHLRLVAKIAMQYRGYGLPLSDLISEGNLGLMKAVKKFDPDRGFRLSTYAMWWIKASVTEYVLRSWSLVKMGTMAAQKKLFFSLRKAKRSLNIIDSQGLDEEQASVLGDKYGMSSSEIALMDQRITRRDLSLNTAVSNSEDEGLEFIDLLEDETKSPEMLALEAQENDIRNKYLLEAIEELTERERHIFKERRLSENPLTLEKLGEYYGISRERVRQLENRAFGKVEKAVRTAARGEV
ncbi:MAG: RNA polymerase sigma factor RpoH [Alphaproteobacteria bacterium MarineAlpha3_Bin7]|nr:MAG: RNA polymerase sigma factor RpoH [Alphaproteobacteria bacterium MarineAlpha3_Bin7]|tara:strand:- start:189 stop:1067 length:879 start_codon:yes stop_codon:yes gene_type:complete